MAESRQLHPDYTALKSFLVVYKEASNTAKMKIEETEWITAKA